MALYDNLFGLMDLQAAQVLVTSNDFTEDVFKSNLCATVEDLLSMNVVRKDPSLLFGHSNMQNANSISFMRSESKGDSERSTPIWCTCGFLANYFVSTDVALSSRGFPA